MRYLTVVLFLACNLTAAAQKIEKYYDYNWHECTVGEARFYSVIKKTDSGWHRLDYFMHSGYLQMEGTYEDSACKIVNGTLLYFYANKMPESRGSMVHGKKQGVCLSYTTNGMTSDSAFFEDDHPVGLRQGWYDNGYPQDSSVWSKDGSGLQIHWFDNGLPSFAGRYVNWDKLTGKWQFFHKNGKLSALEIYDNNKLVQKQYFTEDGNPADTTNNDRPAEFKGGEKGWSEYLSKKLYFPDQYKISNADKAAIVVTFTVDEDGKVQDVFVKTPFYPAFDDIAVDVIKHSPVWKPARNHNRRVASRFSQVVTFSQGE